MISLNNYCNGKRISIYGAGNWGRMLAIYLIEKEVAVDSFVVSSMRLYATREILEIPVKTIDEYENEATSSSALVLAVSLKYREEIKKTLAEKAIENYYVLTDEEVSEIFHQVKYKKKYHFTNNINIVLYHRVADLPIDPRHLSISPRRFEMQLKYFKAHCSMIRTEDDWDDRKSLAITFDDGHYDFCSNVLPLLEKYEVPATVFITTGLIGKEAELWGDELERILYINDYRRQRFEIWGQLFFLGSESERFSSMIRLRNMLKNMPSDERINCLSELSTFLKAGTKPRITHRIMTAAEIQKCAQSSFVTIGAHTVTHCCLAQETKERQIQEIRDSKKALEEIIEKEVTMFAYPYGEVEDFTEETIRIAKSIGLKKIFAVCGGMTNSQYINGRIPRNNVSFCKTEEELSRQMNYLSHVFGDSRV